MSRRALPILLLLAAFVLPVRSEETTAEKLRQVVTRYLGLPYAWGSSGLRSFDCSGFVWRVATDSGFLVKRTTARKLWFSTVPAGPENRGALGNLVFFDDLRHVGLVNNNSSFYHAQSSKGTNLSIMNEYWKPLVVGEHRFLMPARVKQSGP